MRRKAQVTMEFSIIMVFLMLVFAGMFVALQNGIASLKQSNNYDSMSELAFMITNEVQLAARVGDGYDRTFVIPTFIKGENYSLILQDKQDLVIIYEDLEYLSFMEVEVEGDINKGRNRIYNENGIVYIEEI